MGIGRRAGLIRWLCLVVTAIATALLILGLMILPAMFSEVPRWLGNYFREWLALVLAAAYIGARTWSRSAPKMSRL